MNPDDYNDRIRELTEALRKFGSLLRNLFRRHRIPEHDIDDLLFALLLHAFRTFPFDKLQFLPFYVFKAVQLIRDYRRKNRRFKNSQLEFTATVPELPVSRNFASEPRTMVEEQDLKARFFIEFPAPLSREEADCLFYRERGHSIEFTSKISGVPPSQVEVVRRRARRKFCAYVNRSGEIDRKRRPKTPKKRRKPRKKGGDNGAGGRDDPAA